MHCADCHEWSPLSEDPRFGECGSDAFAHGYDRPPFNNVRVDGAIIENDEGWAWFTGRDFGCIHFTAKDGRHTA